MNPFSKDTLELPDLSTVWHIQLPGCSKFNPSYCKLAVPSPLESSLVPRIAVMHEWWGLCIIQPPLVTDTTQGMELLEPFLEISFFGGQLYAIDCSRKLLNIELVEDLGHKAKISSFKSIIDSSDDLLGMPESLSSDERYIVYPYLVECAGKLLMVRRWICPLHSAPCIYHDHTGAFDVFEADLSTKPCRWRSVNDLGGHALFVSSSSSKSFPAGECSGVQENCIYFMNEFPGLKCVVDPLHDPVKY